MAESGAEGGLWQLQQGLAALRSGQAERAIALLEAASVALTGADRVRAQAGLVGAYRSGGRPAEAIALCEALLQHPNPSVRQWATQARSQLPPNLDSKSNPTPNPSPKPIAPPPPPPRPLPANGPPIGDSGFVPFGDPPDAPEAPAGNPIESGFVPLENPQSVGPRTQVVRVAMPPSGTPAANPATSEPTQNPIASPSVPTDRPESPNGPRNPPPTMAVVSAIEAAEDLPIARPVGPPAPPTLEPYELQWRNAGRADRRTVLPPQPRWSHILTQGVAIATLAWLAQQTTFAGVAVYNKLLDWCSVVLAWLPIWGESTPYMEQDPSWSVWIVLALLFLGSPWLLDELIHRWGGRSRKFLELSAERPETARLLQRLVRSRNRSVPYLRVVPTDVPVVVVYGWWPSQMRLAIGQGAIDRLTDGELAALVATQYSQVDSGDAAIASWATVVMGLPYGLYIWGAQAAETWQLWPAKWGAVVVSAVGYGLYRLERWALFGWSRSRQAEADRQGAAHTGDPNALARALVKGSIAIAEQTQTERSLSPWLEVLELLLPLSPRSAAIEGSLYPIAPPEPLWAWGRRNPYRSWLHLNHTHPLTGQRIATLTELAVRWRLEPEFEASDRAAQDQKQRHLPTLTAARPLRPTVPKTLWLQSGPWLGMAAGVGLALTLWVIGGVGLLLRQPIGWMWGDRTLLGGLAWMGLGLGIFLRINPFFPEIRGRSPVVFNEDSPPLASALAEPNALPIDSLMVKVSGLLLGRSGWTNGLWQDLWLQTPSGLLPLHFASRWGWLGSLVRQGRNDLPIGSKVVVTGWLRRGGTPWIDVESLNLVQGRLTSTTNLVTPDAHPLRSVALGAIAVILGFSTLMRFNWL